MQGTPGAELHPALRLPAEAAVVSKGTDPDQDAYSGFQGTGLAGQLRGLGVQRVFVGGLATDYCVRASVLDALSAGLDVTLLEDAVSGVDVNAGDSARAIAEMRDRGARVVSHAPTFDA